MKLRLQAEGDLFVFVAGDAAPKLHFSREGARILAELCCVAELRQDVAHFAEHGSLPPEPPTWGELRVSRRVGDGGWHVWSGDALLASVVSSGAAGRWMCTLHQNVPNVTHDGDTPQSAADAARAWLAERWGLRT